MKPGIEDIGAQNSAALSMPKVQGAIAQPHYSAGVDGEKGDIDKLQKYIRTVGMSTFVKYFEQFANPNFCAGDVKQVMRSNSENWGYNSFNTKASAGKWIINKGYGKEALRIIANANNTDSATIQKARALLET